MQTRHEALLQRLGNDLELTKVAVAGLSGVGGVGLER